MKLYKLSKIIFVLRQISINTRELLKLAWEMDKRITFLYYFTAAIGALVPVAASFVLKLLIDSLQEAQSAITLTVPLIVVFILSARYLVSLIENIVYWGYNQTYLDYIFRYKLQNEITLKFHQKISNLDIAYFENPKTQDLITKVRDTMQ